MKARDFGDFISTFADLLHDASADRQSEAWRSLVPVFQASPSANVSELCKIIRTMEMPSGGSGPTIKELVSLIPSIKSCFARQAKKSLIDDLTRLSETLSPFSDATIEGFVQAALEALSRPKKARATQSSVPSEELVEKYRRELLAALGDEVRFPEIFEALKRDKAVRVSEAKELASRIADITTKTKKEALIAIWDRHAAVLGQRARARATGNRTAA
jgi:hypothetical protein